MEYASPLIDKYNAFVGGFVAMVTCVFGEHWILFAAFLIFNFFDWITGWMKSRMLGKESSVAGLKGVMKKLGYWIMIALAFAVSVVFMEIGESIGVDLGITTFIGWFVLASLLVNEIRSIIENFVEAGFNVPTILVKGLEVADKVINSNDIFDDDVK